MTDSTDLATREQQAPASFTPMGDAEITATYRIASALAASGMFKDVTQAEQAFGRILLGRDLGLSPTQALMGIDVVKGNVQMRGVLLLSFVRKSPNYDYAVTEHTPEAATIEIRRLVDGEWQAEGSERFTTGDAKRAGIWKEGGAWPAHPGNMCLWRAASNAVKFYAPDLLGGIPVYTEADSFDRVPNLAEGTGDGADPGWGDVPIAAVHEVELLLRRAEKLGHAGLASRTAAQMTLSGQTPDAIRAWINAAAAELATLQAKQQVERGEPVSIEGEPVRCPAPDPIRVGVFCDRSQGHEPPHSANGQTWDPFLPDEAPDPDPPSADSRPETATLAGDQGKPTGHVPTGETHDEAQHVLQEELEAAIDEQAEERALADDATAEMVAGLPLATQIELAEAKLAGSRNEKEEREALEELQRLRGDA